MREETFEMKKRLLSFVLAAVLALSLMPGTAVAAEIVNSGYCGDQEDNVTWNLDSDGVLTIAGTGGDEGL